MAWVIHREENQAAGLCRATMGVGWGIAVAGRPGSKQVLVVLWRRMVGQGSPAEAGVVAVGTDHKGERVPIRHPPHRATGRAPLRGRDFLDSLWAMLGLRGALDSPLSEG